MTDEELYSQFDYEDLVVLLIRSKYTQDEEFAILRQRETKPEEFGAYNNWCEECKAYSKKIKGLD